MTRVFTAGRPIAALCALLLLPATAPAGENGVEVVNAWARPSLPGRPAAGYLEIRNTGDTPDTLIAVRSDRAERVTLHASEEKDGVMTMVPVEALEIAAGATATLAPGGRHLMIMGLDAPLAEGERFPVVLEFEAAGEIAADLTVSRDGPGMQDGHGHGSEHGS